MDWFIVRLQNSQGFFFFFFTLLVCHSGGLVCLRGRVKLKLDKHPEEELELEACA